MEARMYLYHREALTAAQEFANEDSTQVRFISSSPRTIDHRVAGIVEDDRFEREVGSWLGETPAIEVTDSEGERIGLFGYWREDWEEAEELERLDNE